MRIRVVVRTTDPHRQSEALRAALGLTLRGAVVDVEVTPPLLTPLAERSAATLRSFGYVVGAPTTPADATEVWTDGGRPHVAVGDVVVYLDEQTDHDDLVARLFR